ncbi:lytic polysaccharide monooxygenase [Actinoplanes sp. URMC 104]|uniref:lytic polysaccharide monooxygenase n=1 Tax=Actinoplanes sp. URMC 104 TaxID=3423409 RepID=UPI003F1B6E37
MRLHRLAAAVLSAAAAIALAPAAPAGAHGSPTTPISRTAACASGGEQTGSAACRAARKANGGDFGRFDNLRIAGVDGKDRQVLPDGELCSGGLDAFRGLDLPRDDFPATKVSAGRTLTIRYRATIPHAGEFRVFLTRATYDPRKPLAWDDLGSKPLVTVTDPALDDGAYVLKAKLPQRAGRHILYVVWETSSTPDTYYSCSDLSFPAAAAARPAPPATKPAAPSKRPAARATTRAAARPVATTRTTRPPETPRPQDLVSAQRPGDDDRVTLGHWIVAGALIFGLAAASWATAGALLRRRRENR